MSRFTKEFGPIAPGKVLPSQEPGCLGNLDGLVVVSPSLLPMILALGGESKIVQEEGAVFVIHRRAAAHQGEPLFQERLSLFEGPLIH